MSDFEIHPNDELAIEELPGAKLVKNQFGTDELTRTYKGSKKFLDQFFREYNYGIRDEEYPSLIIPNEDGAISVDFEEAEMVVISILFKGISGEASSASVTVSGGLSLQSVSLTTDVPSESVNLSYYSPFTTYKYTSPNIPQSPRFSRSEIRTRIEPFNPQPANFEGELQYQVQERLTDLSFDQAGNVFECTETWARVVIAATAIFETD